MDLTAAINSFALDLVVSQIQLVVFVRTFRREDEYWDAQQSQQPDQDCGMHPAE